MSDNAKPYTLEEFDAYRRSGHNTIPWLRLHATVAALAAVTRERDERVEQFRRAARIANELTLETQTPEEWTADLVRQVREARTRAENMLKVRWDELQAESARREKAEAERDEARALNARLREQMEGLLDDMAHTGPQDGDRALYDVSVSRLSMARAALREALEELLENPSHPDATLSSDHDKAVEKARAALEEFK